MADEFKTILKVEGDASGAKRTMEEVAAGAQRMASDVAAAGAGAAAGPVGAAGVGESTQEAIAAANAKAAESQKDLEDAIKANAASAQAAAVRFRLLHAILGLFDPVLAAIAGVASSMLGAVKALFANADTDLKKLRAGIDLQFALVAAGLAAIFAAFKNYADEIVATWKKAQADEMARMNAIAAVRKSVGERLGEMGIGPEATAKAGVGAQRLVDTGFGQDEAVRAAALQARFGLSNEQARQLAAGFKLGQVGDVGRTEESQRRAIEAFERKLARPGEAEANAATIQQAIYAEENAINAKLRAESKKEGEGKGTPILMNPETGRGLYLEREARSGELDPLRRQQQEIHEAAPTSRPAGVTVKNYGTMFMSGTRRTDGNPRMLVN